MSRVHTLEQAQGLGVLEAPRNEDWVSPFLAVLGLTSGVPILYFQEAKGAHVVEASVGLDQQAPAEGRQVCASSYCCQSHVQQPSGPGTVAPCRLCITSWVVSEKAIVSIHRRGKGRDRTYP